VWVMLSMLLYRQQTSINFEAFHGVHKLRADFHVQKDVDVDVIVASILF
jgi:hypothetical protein